MGCSGYVASANPRNRGCDKCGLLPRYHPIQEGFHPPGVKTHPRNVELERRLSDVSARSLGLNGDMGLRDFADARAWPGGVRAGLNATQEAGEELGDASNYLLWRVEQIYGSVEAGESESTAEYERLMRAHAHVVAAWAALVGR